MRSLPLRGRVNCSRRPIATDMALFEAHGISKRFGDHVVLQNLSLAFEQGKLSGIIGPNGAGKTTCFNVLTGRYAPDRGRVLFDGQDITGFSPAAIARKGISRSFQLMNLFDDYTTADNVLVALRNVRAQGFDVVHDLANNRACADRASDVLRQVGLAGKEHVPARRLSYGERRALEIGVALAAEPKLLFLDEPTAGLGPDGTARLTSLIDELKRNVTIVVIEHDMRFLFELADWISVIQWGQVIAEGTAKQLSEDPWVRRSALGAVV